MTKELLLAFDIGNTNIVVGCFKKGEIIAVFRLKSDPEKTVDEYAASLLSLFESQLGRDYKFTRAIISSVVPPLTPLIVGLVRDRIGLEPLVIGPGVKTGLDIKLPEPKSVGSDRIVNALAARELFGTPALVVDFGTATSFDYVGLDGAYYGGIIAPGVYTSVNALVSKTAKLPRIELKWPESVVGNGTETAMQSGTVIGFTCLVDGLIEKVIEEKGELSHIIATGGLGKIFAEHSKKITTYEPNLILKGLYLIASLNS